MRIAYLTWGETPRSYGVFATQAIGQFKEIYRGCDGGEFKFISAVPIFHSGIIREKIKYFAELKNLRSALGDISFTWIPIFISQNFVNTSRWTFRLMFAGTKRKFLKVVQQYQPDIIHCRSYLAAWAALQLRAKYSLQYRILFDARGIYPEEVALKKGYKDHSSNLNHLKEIEKILLEECDVTVAVSDTMAEHFKKLNAKRVETIYLGASHENLKPLQALKKYNACIPVKFCYVGALSEKSWHKPSELAKLFLVLKEHFLESKLIIVSTSNHDDIKAAFKREILDSIILKSYKGEGELREHLNNVDFGLLPYFMPTSDREKLLANMVLAVKTAEYICAGLPVIANKFCGGAANLIKKEGLGVVYDPGCLADLDFEKLNLFLNHNCCRSQISKRGLDLFDYKSQAKKYISLYNQLINIHNN